LTSLLKILLLQTYNLQKKQVYTTIAKIKSKPHIQAKIQDFTRSNIERFQEIQEEALEVYAELMKSENDVMRLTAAKPFVESLKTTKIDLDAKVDGNINIVMTPVKPD